MEFGVAKKPGTAGNPLSQETEKQRMPVERSMRIRRKCQRAREMLKKLAEPLISRPTEGNGGRETRREYYEERRRLMKPDSLVRLRWLLLMPENRKLIAFWSATSKLMSIYEYPAKEKAMNR